MKKVFSLLACLLLFSFIRAQSFEGTLTYKVDFELKPFEIEGFEIKKEDILKKMKDDGEYYDTIRIHFKNGYYLKEDNSSAVRMIIYRPDQNRIYTFQEDFEYVVIANAENVNSLNIDIEAPEITQPDSVIIVNGVECKLLKLSWSLGDELYFYNSETAKIDPALFRFHKQDYLDVILNHTLAYPLEIVKSISNFISVRMTLVQYSPGPVDDALFNLPEFQKPDKDYAKMMLQITGNEVMKIKD